MAPPILYGNKVVINNDGETNKNLCGLFGCRVAYMDSQRKLAFGHGKTDPPTLTIRPRKVWGPSECLEQAVMEHGSKVTAKRNTAVTGSWAHAPPGCSIYSGKDNVAHWNTNKNGKNNGRFTPVGTEMENGKCARFGDKVVISNEPWGATSGDTSNCGE